MSSNQASGLIPDDFIASLVERADIFNYVSQIVTLKNNNHNSYKGLCPFHQEKTPSFHLHRDKQYFHCFGCGEHGNVINFVMKIRNLTFPDTIRTIAEDLNMEMPSNKQQDSNNYQEAYDILNSQSNAFEQELTTNENAKNYLLKRGLAQATIKEFRLGFCSGRMPLIKQQSLAKSIGIIRENGRAYFYNRIMFPIINTTGKVVGFGGRALDNTNPKYLNSKESFVFHKSKILYGLFQAKKHKPEYLIVVEGYMDVIALYQHGIKNAVASLGTAITTSHISLLFKHTKKIACCFDGDAAGQKAAWKTLIQAIPLMGDGYEIKFILLPEGEDPDSLISNRGKEAWKAIFQDALDFSDFFFKNLLSGQQTDSIEQKAKIAKNGKDLLDKMPNSYCKQLMLTELNKVVGNVICSPEVKQNNRPKNNLSELDRILKLIIQNPQIASDLTIPEFLLKQDLCKRLVDVVELIKSKRFNSLASLVAGTASCDLHTTINKFADMPLDLIEGDRLLITLTVLMLKAELALIQEQVRSEINCNNMQYLKDLLHRKSVIISELNNHRELNNV